MFLENFCSHPFFFPIHTNALLDRHLSVHGTNIIIPLVTWIWNLTPSLFLMQSATRLSLIFLPSVLPTWIPDQPSPWSPSAWPLLTPIQPTYVYEWFFQNTAFIIFFSGLKITQWLAIASRRKNKPFPLGFKVFLTPTYFFSSILLPSYTTLIFCSKLLLQPEVHLTTPGIWLVFLPLPLLCPPLPGRLPWCPLFASLSESTQPLLSLHTLPLQMHLSHRRLNCIAATTVMAATIYWSPAVYFTHIVCHQIPLPCKVGTVTPHILQVRKQRRRLLRKLTKTARFLSDRGKS